MKNLFRIGSLQEKIVKDIVAGRDFDQIVARMKIKRSALMSNLTQIKKKLGIKVRGHEELFKRIIEQKKGNSDNDGSWIGKPKLSIDPYRGLSGTDAEAARDNDDVDLAAKILSNKIYKRGRLFGRTEIVKRMLDHVIAEIKILVSARE